MNREIKFRGKMIPKNEWIFSKKKNEKTIICKCKILATIQIKKEEGTLNERK